MPVLGVFPLTPRATTALCLPPSAQGPPPHGAAAEQSCKRRLLQTPAPSSPSRGGGSSTNQKPRCGLVSPLPPSQDLVFSRQREQSGPLDFSRRKNGGLSNLSPCKTTSCMKRPATSIFISRFSASPCQHTPSSQRDTLSFTMVF